MQRELVTAGYPAVLVKVRIDGDTHYRVNIAGFKNKKIAKGFRRSTKGKFGITKPRISQRTPCSHGHLRALATIPSEKCGLGRSESHARAIPCLIFLELAVLSVLGSL